MKAATTAISIIPGLGLCPPPPIEVECDAFSGSLATLFHVVRVGKIDLLGVPLTPICKSYWEYLAGRGEEDLDVAGTALIALSYLVERKAEALLPKPEVTEAEGPEIDFGIVPRDVWQAPIAALMDGEERMADRFFRGDRALEGYELPYELDGVSPRDLAAAFRNVWDRAHPSGPEIKGRTRRSLADQMNTVQLALGEDFTALPALVPGEWSRLEAVWWFLALLELVRLGRAAVKVDHGEVLFAKEGEVAA